jgi:hypothetical protein
VSEVETGRPRDSQRAPNRGDGPARRGNRANKAALEHLAEAFDVPPSSIRLIRGERSRHKTFEIDGVDQAALAPLLEMLLANRDRDSPGTLLSEDD